MMIAGGWGGAWARAVNINASRSQAGDMNV